MAPKPTYSELKKRVAELEGLHAAGNVANDDGSVRKALKESEAKYQRLFERSRDAIFLVDKSSGRYLDANAAALKIAGRSLLEIKGMTTADITLEGAARRLELLASCQETLDFGEVVYIRPDGSRRVAELSAVPLDDERVFGIAHDITDEIMLQDRLRQARKMEAIGTLAGGIAHDFNNILFPLVGFAEMLQDDLPQDSPLQDYVDEILQAALRSKELVKQILAFSRQTDQEIKPIKLQSIAGEALKLIRASVPATIKIEQEIDPGCGVVLADPTQIHQIIMNLATNAFHAMEDKGGTLTVTLGQIRLEPDSSNELELVAGDYACLAVADTGIGIEKGIMDKIFDPYFTTKAKSKGTGLGLSVVQGIVKSCHGDIRISSEPGMGTHIQVFLPVLERKPESSGVGYSQAIAGGNEKILLVDDELAIIRLEKKMLERLGYQVAERTSSADALKAFQCNPDAYDLVITDMTMPDMTGDQLAGKMMAIKPGLPVIICTGCSVKIDDEKVRAMGIKGMLMKPVIQSEMACMVRQVLDASKQ